MGRRGLLLFGAIGMCTAQFIVAITGTAASADNIAAQRAAIAFVCICMFFWFLLPLSFAKRKKKKKKKRKSRGFLLFLLLLPD